MVPGPKGISMIDDAALKATLHRSSSCSRRLTGVIMSLVPGLLLSSSLVQDTRESRCLLLVCLNLPPVSMPSSIKCALCR